MLGEDQQAWFDEVATGHAAVWTTVVQQVVLPSRGARRTPLLP